MKKYLPTIADPHLSDSFLLRVGSSVVGFSLLPYNVESRPVIICWDYPLTHRAYLTISNNSP